MGLFDELEPSTHIQLGGFKKPIPVDTKLLCAVAGVTIEPEDQNKNEHVRIQLHVIEKGEYENRTEKHNIQVNHDDYDKKQKALAMLLAYDANSKGELLAMDRAGNEIIDELTLAHALNGSQVVATFDVWEIDMDDGGTMSGNWVRGISSAREQGEDKAMVKQAENQPDSPVASAPAEDSFQDFDDEPGF